MPLNNPPSYAAVSYVRGNSLVTKIITVNGQIPIVRSNGDTALLWINAISIDQNNIDERREQIVIMRQIYSKAMFFYIWLGYGSQKTERLVQGLSEFDWPAAKSYFLSSIGQTQVPPLTWHVDIFPTLWQLTRLQHWSRIWIAQEFHQQSSRTTYWST
ncbi:hypothetical protein BU25DRAFT_456854 [Macroventuria anomochaeta]|uniref:Uncharacterized protein n=1 Tax=Macroventuria anomochaeta TaxID=301207 RepID=A0ACB6S6Q6_9PLEO|nr:uncharacterized protein BU25DRAFT_456854 [Macroventuria anomochaeta]KAF2629801.1 hypothetical protein BU25DRAFT_456854 [Macroventuria anomochaeta]